MAAKSQLSYRLTISYLMELLLISMQNQSDLEASLTTVARFRFSIRVSWLFNW
jgi:hypothetical protein